MTTLARKAISLPSNAPKLAQCFRALGFAPHVPTREIFRDSVTAGAVLHECRLRWRAACREHHPDTGGCSKTMATINRAWSRVVELFGFRGCALGDERPKARTLPPRATYRPVPSDCRRDTPAHRRVTTRAAWARRTPEERTAIAMRVWESRRKAA